MKCLNIKYAIHVTLRANANVYEIQDITLINLLLKLASQASIFSNIQTEKLFQIIFSTVFNLDHQHFVSSLPYAKHKYI